MRGQFFFIFFCGSSLGGDKFFFVCVSVLAVKIEIKILFFFMCDVFVFEYTLPVPPSGVLCKRTKETL